MKSWSTGIIELIFIYPKTFFSTQQLNHSKFLIIFDEDNLMNIIDQLF